ncbi:MAG: FkbM family methyltransferase [Bacteroidota bacterium]
MKYLKKLSFYKLSEVIIVLLMSIVDKLSSRIPFGLRGTHLLISHLVEKNIKIDKRESAILFNHKLNKEEFKFNLLKNSSDPLVFNQIVLHEEYLPLIQLMDSYNITPKVMVDAGSNIGLTSLYFKAFYSDLKIIALEPNRETFNRLQTNLVNNNLKNIHPVNKGLWSEKAQLYAKNEDSMDWGFSLTDSPKQEEGGSFQVISIPDLIEDFQLDSISVLKIDVEGGEEEIFKKKNNLDWLYLVDVIAIEVHDIDEYLMPIINILLKYEFEVSFSGELTVGISKRLIQKKP